MAEKCVFCDELAEFKTEDFNGNPCFTCRSHAGCFVILDPIKRQERST